MAHTFARSIGAILMQTGRYFAVAVSLLLGLANAHAYGPIGHQIVGAIADRRLANTATGAKVNSLIEGFTLEKAAVIADEIKGWDKRGVDDPGIFHYSARPQLDAQLREFWKANPPTKDLQSQVPSHHWFHYTDVPVVDSQKYADHKAGRSQWDIVHMIPYCLSVLRGEITEENERKITKPLAVILLAHYLGDIHQPLHVGAEYFDQSGKVVDPDRVPTAIEDQGGNTLVLVLKSRVPITGNFSVKMHAFWDNDCVMANFPALPETMPKEERRAKMDEARQQLVDRLAQKEPANWRVKAANWQDYSRSLADEILPIAREAHERLQFRDFRPQKDESGATFATAIAEEKSPPARPSYAEWSTDVVLQEMHKAGWRLADLLEQTLK